MLPVSDRRTTLRVVVFSGGRGSDPLVRALIGKPGLSITIAINGYDDGRSTGEVRRFLGDSLGPSDFRKNAARVARELGTCAPDLLAMLDARLPQEITSDIALTRLASMPFTGEAALCLAAFVEELRTSGKPFEFGDCSIGNLVFAGAYLRARRSFNGALDAYRSILGLPPGMIENVTDGQNAYLVALAENGHVLKSEEAIVDARRRDRIKEILLLERAPLEESWDELRRLEASVRLNPQLAGRIGEADLIIYAPGTQHSSLFPSYLTRGLAEAIGSNLRAIKLLVTNLEDDAEITGSTAVDLIERALFYLRLKASRQLPAPCLITHYLINEPGADPARPYVPLGPVESIEDPRLVRIGGYEDGLTGQHDAARVIGPFIDALMSRPPRPRVALLLHDSRTANTLAQTLLEMVRGGIESVPLTISIFYLGSEVLDRAMLAGFPLRVQSVSSPSEFARAIRSEEFDYVGLLDSSGMYRGEDVVALSSHLMIGRLDAVWGSRRLSTRDIHESYRVRYRHNAILGAISYFGSHILSLAYLLLYGRYVSDTLSGVRIVRSEYVLGATVDVNDDRINQYLLSSLLRDRADLLELPVRFVPMSPDKVKRPGVLDGIRSLAVIFVRRFSGRRRSSQARQHAPTSGGSAGRAH